MTTDEYEKRFAELNAMQGIIAQCADVLNTWCRESQVEQCEKPFVAFELRNCIDRLWQKVSGDLARATELVNELKPYYDAVREAHNGYNEVMRQETGCQEPESPVAAIRELIDEAEEIGRKEGELYFRNADGNRD